MTIDMDPIREKIKAEAEAKAAEYDHTKYSPGWYAFINAYMAEGWAQAERSLLIAHLKMGESPMGDYAETVIATESDKQPMKPLREIVNPEAIESLKILNVMRKNGITWPSDQWFPMIQELYDDGMVEHVWDREVVGQFNIKITELGDQLLDELILVDI